MKPFLRRLLWTFVALASVIKLECIRSFAQVVGNPDQSTPPPLGQLVDIGGRRLHLLCKGSGFPIVVVESGSSGFSIDWALVLPEVAKFTRICTYDRAGFAWSDAGPEFDTVEQAMNDLHLLLRTANIAPPYVLVGHSIGGLYVRAFQRRYPRRRGRHGSGGCDAGR